MDSTASEVLNADGYAGSGNYKFIQLVVLGSAWSLIWVGSVEDVVWMLYRVFGWGFEGWTCGVGEGWWQVVCFDVVGLLVWWGYVRGLLCCGMVGDVGER